MNILTCSNLYNCLYDSCSLTVNKEGPNKGRPFFACQKPKTQGGCNYFAWADENNDSTQEQTSKSQRCVELLKLPSADHHRQHNWAAVLKPTGVVVLKGLPITFCHTHSF